MKLTVILSHRENSTIIICFLFMENFYLKPFWTISQRLLRNRPKPQNTKKKYQSCWNWIVVSFHSHSDRGNRKVWVQENEIKILTREIILMERNVSFEYFPSLLKTHREKQRNRVLISLNPLQVQKDVSR